MVAGEASADRHASKVINKRMISVIMSLTRAIDR